MATRVTVSCVTRLLSSMGDGICAFLARFYGFFAFLASFLVALDFIGCMSWGPRGSGPWGCLWIWFLGA